MEIHLFPTTTDDTAAAGGGVVSTKEHAFQHHVIDEPHHRCKDDQACNSNATRSIRIREREAGITSPIHPALSVVNGISPLTVPILTVSPSINPAPTPSAVAAPLQANNRSARMGGSPYNPPTTTNSPQELIMANGSLNVCAAHPRAARHYLAVVAIPARERAPSRRFIRGSSYQGDDLRLQASRPGNK